MDAAVPVDAQNAPTATWKTAQHAVSHSAHTHQHFAGEEDRKTTVERQPTSHTKFLTLPGRFDPLDFARFVKMASASLAECKNHLGDAVDRRHITEDIRLEHLARWEQAMKELGGLLGYLQSPEAKGNAERLRQRRIERRRNRNPEPGT